MKFPNLLNLLKEPLVQFTLLGALIFGIDHIMVVNRDDPKNILIGDSQIKELIDIFEEGQGRSPSGLEINNMVIVWAQNEILYREARRMGLDRGDDMIRNRLILKIRNVLFNNVVVNDPTEAQLQAFFEFNKAAYYIPERYDIEMIALPTDYDLVSAQAVLERAVSEGIPDAYLANRYEYKNRPQNNLVEMFGVQESNTLLASMSNEKPNEKPNEELTEKPNANRWVLISPGQRHHLVRITAKREAVEPALDSVRSQVTQDYDRYSGDTQISDQTFHIAQQYRVHLDVSDNYLKKMENELPRNLFQDAPAVNGKLGNDNRVGSDLAVDER